MHCVKHRLLKTISFISVIVLSTAGLRQVAFAQSGPPNIIFITTDDQRWDTMQYMPITQKLLQAKGVTFENYFITQSICCPSRSTFLTGLNSHHHGIWSNTGGGALFAKLGEDKSTVGTWLSAAGYRTALIGKYLNDWEGSVPWPYRPPGWSVWQAHGIVGDPYVRIEDDGDSVYYLPGLQDSSLSIATRAVDFIIQTPAAQPLFLYFATSAPHLPAPAPTQDDAVFSKMPAWNPPSFNERDTSDKPAAISNLPLLTAAQIAQIQLDRKDQIGSLQGVDRAVGRFIDALTVAGRINNTVIIYTSDNGLMWGEHRLQGKNQAYEEAIRVPLIIAAPGVAPRVETKLISNVDIAPTIADYAGVAPDLTPDGMSLKPLINNTSFPWRDAVFLELVDVHGLRTADHLYTEWRTGETELYDLTTDPFELKNIAGDPAQQALITALSAQLATFGPVWPPKTGEGGGD